MQTTNSLITTDLNLRKDFKLHGVKKGQDSGDLSRNGEKIGQEVLTEEENPGISMESIEPKQFVKTVLKNCGVLRSKATNVIDTE